jgi:hypothetical protein
MLSTSALDGPALNLYQTTMTSFRVLEKAILSKEQLTAFQSSKTYGKVTSYIETLNNAVIGFKLTDECAQSQVRPGSLRPCVSLGCSPIRGCATVRASRR